ncbi:MAG: hypothetical protein LUG61_11235 [Lachnospiraceae bacterium]|nr:hypothetical protein [Lachnospiraceae bacterium]
MSVPENERGDRKMQVFVKANDLVNYTIRICCNKKVFLPEYQNALTNDIIRTAKDIFIFAWEANEIRVTDNQGKVSQTKYVERRRLQEISIRRCNDLLALMQMAKRLFHLKARRIKYWGRRTTEARELLVKWRDADTRRYGHLDLP